MEVKCTLVPSPSVGVPWFSIEIVVFATISMTAPLEFVL